MTINYTKHPDFNYTIEKSSFHRQYCYAFNDKVYKYNTQEDLHYYFQTLRLLGFNLTSNRKQGKRQITIGHKKEKISISWFQYDSESIKKGMYLNNLILKNSNQYLGDRKEHETKIFENLIPVNIPYVIKKHLKTQKKPRVYRKTLIGNSDHELLCNYDLSCKLQLQNNVYGINEHDFSNVLCLDLDAHLTGEIEKDDKIKKDVKKSLDLIFKYFKKENLLYTEISPLGGYHLYFKLNDWIYKKHLIYEKIEILNKKNNTSIEYRKPSKIFQLPDSCNYMPIEITNYNTYEYKEIETIKEIYFYIFNKINNPNIGLSYADFSTIKEKKDPELIIPKSSVTTQYPNYSGKTKTNNISFTRGNRCREMFTEGKIFRVYEEANKDYNQFCLLLREYNSGSYDLTNNFSKTAQYAYKWASSHYKETISCYKKDTSKSFVDNSFHVPDNWKPLIKKLSNNLYTYLELDYKYNKTREDSYQALNDLMLHLIGSIIFNKDYDKKLSSHIKMKKKKKEIIEENIQFFFGTYSEYRHKINTAKLNRLLLQNVSFFEKIFDSLYFPSYGIKTTYSITDLDYSNYYNSLYNILNKEYNKINSILKDKYSSLLKKVSNLIIKEKTNIDIYDKTYIEKNYKNCEKPLVFDLQGFP